MGWLATFRMTAILASLRLCSPGMAHPPLLTGKGAVGGDHRSGDAEDLGGLETEVGLAARKTAITSHIGGGCDGPTTVPLNDACCPTSAPFLVYTPASALSPPEPGL